MNLIFLSIFEEFQNLFKDGFLSKIDTDTLADSNARDLVRSYFERTVIAVTNYGCVGESQMGNSVVVSDCSASVGDVISAEFYAPASDKNGYYDRIYEKLAVVEP